jgi:hypothetical protein
MKKFISLFAVLLLAVVSASAQIYNSTVFNVGTNAVPANYALSLPLPLGTQIITNALTGYSTNTTIITNSAIAWSYGSPTTNTTIFTNGATIYTNSVINYTNQSWVTNLTYVTNTVVTPTLIDNLNIPNTYTTNTVTVTNTTTYFVVTNANGLGYSTNISVLATNTTLSLNSAFATNTLYGSYLMDVTRASSANITASFKLTGAGTSPIWLVFSNATAIGLPDTSGNYSIPITANGANTVTFTTNINNNNYGWLQWGQIINSNAVPVTNLSIRVVQKVLFQ